MGTFRTIAMPALLLALGMAIMFYPFVSDLWNSVHASWAVQSIDEACHAEQQSRLQQLWDDATAYNQHLLQADCGASLPSSMVKQYGSELSVDASGIMGSVSIPSIGVELPIYHGTGEDALSAGAGHVEWSSLPVGGSGSHCVIAGHTGLPTASLFSHLDQVELGDYFVLTCLGNALYYEIDDKRVVGPADSSTLGIVAGEDLCTLLTCTPYGVNTSRLLVRGHRVDGIPAQSGAPQDTVLERAGAFAMAVLKWVERWYLVLLPCALTIIFVLLAVLRRRQRGRRAL